MLSVRKPSVRMTPQMFEGILADLCSGIPIDRQCKHNKDLPHKDTIYDYMKADSERHRKYTQAREQFSHSVADEVIDIADTVPDAQRARNMIVARQWTAAKINPKVYGDKIDIDINNKIDVSIAIAQGRRRAGVIEHSPTMITDINESTPNDEDIDPFA